MLSLSQIQTKIYKKKLKKIRQNQVDETLKNPTEFENRKSRKTLSNFKSTVIKKKPLVFVFLNLTEYFRASVRSIVIRVLFSNACAHVACRRSARSRGTAQCAPLTSDLRRDRAVVFLRLSLLLLVYEAFQIILIVFFRFLKRSQNEANRRGNNGWMDGSQ